MLPEQKAILAELGAIGQSRSLSDDRVLPALGEGLVRRKSVTLTVHVGVGALRVRESSDIPPTF
jgi:hypothetical protein